MQYSNVLCQSVHVSICKMSLSVQTYRKKKRIYKNANALERSWKSQNGINHTKTHHLLIQKASDQVHVKDRQTVDRTKYKNLAYSTKLEPWDSTDTNLDKTKSSFKIICSKRQENTYSLHEGQDVEAHFPHLKIRIMSSAPTILSERHSEIHDNPNNQWLNYELQLKWE